MKRNREVITTKVEANADNNAVINGKIYTPGVPEWAVPHISHMVGSWNETGDCYVVKRVMLSSGTISNTKAIEAKLEIGSLGAGLVLCDIEYLVDGHKLPIERVLLYHPESRAECAYKYLDTDMSTKARLSNSAKVTQALAGYPFMVYLENVNSMITDL